MRKSYHATLIMLALLGGLCAWFFIYEQKVRPDKAKAEEKEKQLITLDTKEIQEIELTRTIDADLVPSDHSNEVKPALPAKKETYKFKKVGGEWHLTAPVDAPADDYMIESMLTALQQNKQERLVDEKPKNTDVYGLKEPLIELSVKKDSASAPQVIHVGKDTPVGSGLYVRTGTSESVYRAPKALRSSLDKDLKTFRRKTLTTVSRFDVTEVEIAPASGASTVLKKGDKDKWLLAKQDFAADNNEWGKTLNALLDLKATDFPAENPSNLAGYGLKPASYTVTFQTGSGEKAKRTSILIGKAKNKYYAKTSDKPIVYEVDKDIFDKVSRPWTDYRTMEMAAFDRFNVKRIKLEAGKNVIELLKENSAWTFPTEPQTKVDNAKVDSLLSSLQDIKIQHYADGKSAPSAPALVVRIFEKKDDKEVESAVLMFAKPSGKEALGARAGLKTPFFIKAEDFNNLNRSKASFLVTTEPEKKS